MNILKQGHLFQTPLCILFFSCASAQAVYLQTSAYGVPFLQSHRQYKKLAAVELHDYIEGLVYDLRYATTLNFTNKRMYPKNTSTTFLRKLPAKALKEVQEELKSKELKLKIFDAYRPYSVTIAFWNLIQDERYVAHPKKASGHNRGLAVDITLLDATTNKELDMGTGFDNFTDSAHHNFSQLPATLLRNRLLLKSTMLKHGFLSLETEWWHYYWPNDKEYEVLDIPFDKFK
jgi:zinc D-Ala-D-Ala dipeptidase